MTKVYVVLSYRFHPNTHKIFCVFNTLTNRPHSFWNLYKDAFNTASDLNKLTLD